MKLSDLNRSFPLRDGLIEVVAKTKKKQGYIKVHLPDEMINHLMKQSLGIKTSGSYFTVAYLENKEES